MSTNDSVKVLCVGPPSANSSIEQLFSKVNGINQKHGPFDMLLIAGNLFENSTEEEVSKIIDGDINPPISTYFTMGSKPLPTEINNRIESRTGAIISDGNVFMLSKSTILNTSNGLRIGSFGGIHDPSTMDKEVNDDHLKPEITSSTLRNFALHFEDRSMNEETKTLAQAKAKTNVTGPLDILLTHTWPASITLLSNKQLPSLPDMPLAHSWGSSAVTSALSYSTPKYVFTGGQNAFYEREPYVNSNGTYTRFISLGQFGNNLKQRWFYAFNISKRGNSDGNAPPGCTACPLPTLSTTSGKKRNNDDETNYIFGNMPSAYASSDKSKKKKQKLGEITQDECWFCLSNPKVTKHLIVSIGDECYVTLPKGQLPDPKDCIVPGGGHVLIIPIAHYPNLFSLPSEHAQPIMNEILDYRESIKKCYEKYDAIPITFEIGRYWSRGGHAHIQVVPVPKSKLNTIAHEFIKEGKSQGVKWEENPLETLDNIEEGQSYLRVDLPDGKKFVHLIKPQPFNQQFPRHVIANILGCPERMDWQNCKNDEGEESKQADVFKETFKNFDKFS